MQMDMIEVQALPRRKIGATELEVVTLGLGCASLGNLYRPVSDEQAKETAQCADRVRQLEKVCDEFQVSLPAAALQFPLACPSVASVIVGMGNPQRITPALKLFSMDIPTEFWQALHAEGLLHPAAPVPESRQTSCA